MANQEIRAAAKESGVQHWKIADALGVSDGTFCRWLRTELGDEEKTKILEIISALKEGKAPVKTEAKPHKEAVISKLNDDSETPVFLKINDASKATGLSTYYLRTGCRDGSIPCIQAGRSYYINVRALLRQLGAE